MIRLHWQPLPHVTRKATVEVYLIVDYTVCHESFQEIEGKKDTALTAPSYRAQIKFGCT